MTHPLSQITCAFLKERHLESPGLVAVSGGPDSVALAHVLVNLHRIGHFPALHLIHLNHQLRGLESDEDEAFVKSLPTHWHATNVTVHNRRVDVAALANREGWNLEDAGRRARYAYFAEIATQTGARWVATAHTADDQAETILMRILRGAGLSGQAGIAAERPLTEDCRLIRPWLSIRKSDVMAYLAEHHLHWREDASNASDKFLRNRIRMQLMPLIEKDYQPAIVPLLGRLSRQAGEVQSFLNEQTELLRQKAERPRAGDLLVFDLATLSTCPPVLLRELFRFIWQRENWPLSDMGAEQWERLGCLVAGVESAMDLPGNIHVRRKEKIVQVSRRMRS